MARIPGNGNPGQALPVIQRGNRHYAVFFPSTDYTHYHEDPPAALDEYVCAVHVYVFVTNHVHLLLTHRTNVQ